MGIIFLLGLIWGTHHYSDKIKKSSIETLEYIYYTSSPEYDFSKVDDDGYSKDPTFTLKSNTQYMHGINMEIERYKFAIAASDGTSSKEESDKDLESSRVFEINLYGNTPSVEWEIFYQKMTGFYVSEADVIDTDEMHQAEHTAYGINLVSYFTYDFQLKQNPYLFDKRQKNDHGLLVGIRYLNNSLSSNHLIPDKYKDDFEKLENLEKLESETLNLAFGWNIEHTFKNNYFINFSVAILKGTQNQKLYMNETITKSQSSSGTELHLDFGYKFTSTILGLYADTQTQDNMIEDHNVLYRRSIIGFYYKFYF